jgi:hypothetical protein
MKKNEKVEYSYFAPAERDPERLVTQQKNKIEASEFLDKILAKTPFMFLILNDKRQVIYSNHILAEHLGFESMDETIGSRPGEIFNCVNSDKEPGGCGTSEHCRYCGAIEAILESKISNRYVSRDSVINMKSNGRVEPGNFNISSRPFDWEGESFYIITIEDISSNKRKEQLERTFFHDIKNKAGTVSGFLQLLKTRKDDSKNELYFELAVRGILELLEDIEYQRQLLLAENGDLKVRIVDIDIKQVIINACADFHEMARRYEVSIRTDFPEADTILKSDPVLLKRLLGNLLKNAIEASTTGEVIIAGYHSEQNSLVIQVKNPVFIPKDIQYKIFNRSFSSKGDGRGIGTYSIKLFTEEYLKGKVYFTSSEQVGTIFNISLPYEG